MIQSPSTFSRHCRLIPSESQHNQSFEILKSRNNISGSWQYYIQLTLIISTNPSRLLKHLGNKQYRPLFRRHVTQHKGRKVLCVAKYYLMLPQARQNVIQILFTSSMLVKFNIDSCKVQCNQFPTKKTRFIWFKQHLPKAYNHFRAFLDQKIKF